MSEFQYQEVTVKSSRRTIIFYLYLQCPKGRVDYGYIYAGTLGGDYVTHTYPHKPLRKIKVTICNHQADSPLYVWPDVGSGDLKV